MLQLDTEKGGFILHIPHHTALQLGELSEARQLTEVEALEAIILNEYCQEFKAKHAETAAQMQRSFTKDLPLEVSYLKFAKDAYTRAAAIYYIENDTRREKELERIKGDPKELAKLTKHLYSETKKSLKKKDSIEYELAIIALERVDFLGIAAELIKTKQEATK